MHRDDSPSNGQQSAQTADPWAYLANPRGTSRQEERGFLHALSQALDRLRCLVWEIRLVATEQQRLVEMLSQIVQEYDRRSSSSAQRLKTIQREPRSC